MSTFAVFAVFVLLFGVAIFVFRRFGAPDFPRVPTYRHWRLPGLVDAARDAIQKGDLKGVRAEIAETVLAWLDGRLGSPVVLDVSVGRLYTDARRDFDFGRDGVREFERLTGLDFFKGVTTNEQKNELKNRRAEKIALLLVDILDTLLPNAAKQKHDPGEVLAKIERILSDGDGFSYAYFGTPLIVANAWSLCQIADLFDVFEWNELADLRRPFLQAAFGTRFKDENSIP